MSAKPKIVNELKTKVIKLHNQGLNSRQIAKTVEVARCTIKSFLKSQGLVPHKRTDGYKHKIYQEFVHTVKSGIEWTIARKQFKISYVKARKILIEKGIQPRDRNQSAQDKRLTLSQIHDRLKSESQVFLGIEDGKYKIEDKATGNIWLKSPYHLKRDKLVRKANLTEEDLAHKLSEIGYTLTIVMAGGRSPSHSVISALCPKGHVRITRFYNFATQGCASCQNVGVSNTELELLSAIQVFWPSACKYKFKERVTRPKEIDIYIPELKLGIEYCGLYSHSISETAEQDVLSDSISEEKRAALQKEIDTKEQNHATKMLMAQKQGINLITVFENDWIDRNHQVWSYLKSKMGCFDKTYHGRKCTVKEINKELGREFIDSYHIQGSENRSNLFFGLYLNEELISVMSFGRHPRNFNSPEEICLNRYAVKDGVRVHGGASKIFKHALSLLQKSGFKKVLSWSDNRWSDGSVYKALGFHLDPPKRSTGQKMGLTDGSIWPDKYFVVGKQLLSDTRYKTIKSANPDIKSRIIYDCGKKRWVYEI